MARWFVYEQYNLDTITADCVASAFRTAEAMYGPSVVDVRCRPRPAGGINEGLPLAWDVVCERVVGTVEARDVKTATAQARMWWPGVVDRVQSVASVEAGEAERRFRPVDDDQDAA